MGQVKQILLPMLVDRIELEQVTLGFGGRLMDDAALFYVDHFMMLPAFITVFIHGVPWQAVEQRARDLRQTARRD